MHSVFHTSSHTTRTRLRTKTFLILPEEEDMSNKTSASTAQTAVWGHIATGKHRSRYIQVRPDRIKTTTNRQLATANGALPFSPIRRFATFAPLSAVDIADSSALS